MQKVMIIGSPGAGKSTFARALAQKTGLVLYYLDQIWHKSDRTTLTKEEFDRRLCDLVATDAWIIDGNYQRTLEVRLRACDTVFLLDFPLDVCLAGAQSRIGTLRPDLPYVEEEFDAEFRNWIIDFPKKQLPNIYALLEQYRNHKQVIVFHSREEVNAYLEEME